MLRVRLIKSFSQVREVVSVDKKHTNQLHALRYEDEHFDSSHRKNIFSEVHKIDYDSIRSRFPQLMSTSGTFDTSICYIFVFLFMTMNSGITILL